MSEKKIFGKFSHKMTRDNFLIVILVGVLLLVIAWPVEEKEKKSQPQSGKWDSDAAIMNLQSEAGKAGGTGGSEKETLSYAESLEHSLEELLGAMEGVGRVRVMVTLEGSALAVVEKDQSTVREGTTEVDSAGGSRNTTDITQSEQTIYSGGQGSGGSPYVKQVLSPRVEGVVVCAQGGGSAGTIRNITEAIQALFGLEAHKIKIVKMISQ